MFFWFSILKEAVTTMDIAPIERRPQSSSESKNYNDVPDGLVEDSNVGEAGDTKSAEFLSSSNIDLPVAPIEGRPRRNRESKSYEDIPDENSDEDDGSEATNDMEVLSSSNTDLVDTDDEYAGAVDRDKPVKTKRTKAVEPSAAPPNLRKSNRTNKFRSSLTEPSFADFINDDEEESNVNNGSNSKRKENTKRVLPTSPYKSPARRHVQRRRSLANKVHEETHKKHGDDDIFIDDDDSESADDDEFDDDVDEEPLKIQRILASRTETKAKWRDICRDMNTSEINFGSRWYQDEAVSEEDEAVFVERFLVKWSDLSFLHVSWETEHDLIDQVEAKPYLTTFFRKAVNGFLYSPDERCDGNYFDPGYTEIDRILAVQLPENWDKAKKLTADNVDVWDSKAFCVILDKADPEYDNGTGRQFLIKWSNMSYSEATYEFERDLIMNEIDYKEKNQQFLQRNTKASKSERRLLLRQGEDEYKRLYKIFGNKSTLSDADREKSVEDYKQKLQETVYKNGGQLRDYQAEGVAWMIANFVNQRSSILADEMGLGKTLQTAATADLLANALHRGGPVLIVAPLSTLTHWHREFLRWTDLNAIVYHGSAEDRQLIREHEFVYQCDRPDTELGFNQVYLRKCAKKNATLTESPWMIDIVITSPEMMTADDAVELSAVQWEVLVVDEAHRLKNYNSKLSVGLRNEKFTFRYRILLTGTPIQNDVQEFWALLNFIDPESFNSLDDFMSKYGEMKSKERVDELHDEIRPYILRRLKEDVEKSVPPKEETLIEVELTVAQKQYYRALYEKNVKFLHKNNKKALDGPSLSNLAMQLRKCCNHLFLLNGVEAEFRRTHGAGISEADFLVMGSGKLILLDKLLPRLKEEGHRVLLFSQFKIMLDILEDYLKARGVQFERIDGSITGRKRQQAIDRFQTPSTATKEAPFIMLLSTRAGGVGITLTAADTCIIVDSDWNPQNDLQAQARCHRIGQTKSVKVYRLLSRKTYEMQMFHMSSLKMGLDQAVLKGFENGSSGEGSLSKAEVERLLRHGAYDIFNEEKAGEAEAESNEFVQQDIDSILQRRSQTIVQDNTGSKSNAAGGTFSKASFKSRTSGLDDKGDDIDLEDPDFWKKMIGEGNMVEDEETMERRRTRALLNYSENDYKRQLNAALELDNDDGKNDDDRSYESDGAGDYVDPQIRDENNERLRWGGTLPNEWKKDDVDNVVKTLSTVGYGRLPWKVFVQRSELSKNYDELEVRIPLLS
jgi:SNF2 family DNA or RNA helicase